MRNLVKSIVFLVWVLTSYRAAAQDPGFHLGVRFGVGQANFRIDSLPGETGKLMLSGGFHASYQFVRFFAIEAEGLVTAKGAKASGRNNPGGIFSQPDNYDEIYRLTYIEIPVMAKLSIPVGNLYLKAYAGPSFNFNIAATHSINYENSNDYDETGKSLTGIHTTETAGVGGIGLDVQTDKGIYSLDLRASMGFTKFGTISSTGKDGYNNYFGVFAGYTF